VHGETPLVARLRIRKCYFPPRSGEELAL
jgi:hypothetical protein